jgi:hypothetical protein
MKKIITANGSIMHVEDEEAEKMVNGEEPYLPGDYYYHDDELGSCKEMLDRIQGI